MAYFTHAEQRALQALTALGRSFEDATRVLEALQNAGLKLADEQRNELVCRWVNVNERAVPPEADTIIRTITRTTDGFSTSSTHWLEGLRSPILP